MKCPKCGKDMTSGFVECGGRPVSWMGKTWDRASNEWEANRKHRVHFSGLVMTYDGMARKYPTAYHCPECKKIVIDY